MQRFFPRVSASFYHDQAKLASLTRPLGYKEALWTRPRSTESFPFIRIASLHRCAFDAEIDGRWDRADFYWTELRRLFLATPASDACWNTALRAVLPESSGMTGPEFRTCFLHQVILDSHAGFFLGEVEAGLSPTARPIVHLRALGELIRAAADITEGQERLLTDSFALAMTGADHAPESPDVAAFWVVMLECFPRQAHYQNAALAEIHTRRMRQLQSAAPANRLQVTLGAIGEVARLRTLAPSNLACYQLLGILYHDLAIQSANERSLQDALLALKKAEVYGGPTPQLSETQSQMQELMAALGQRVAGIQQALRAKPGASLTADGERFVTEFETAPVAARNWELSESASQALAARKEARAIPDTPFILPDPQTSPHIQPVTTTKVSGEERFADWLASPAGRSGRLQFLVAAVLVLLASGLLAREWWATHRRQEALARVERALTVGNDVATLDALRDFFSAPRPYRAVGPPEPPLAKAYGQAIARWLASKSVGGNSQGLTEQDRKRILRYKQQIVEKGLDSSEEE